MVCKSWNASIATGLSSMEVDMHNDPAVWAAKMAKLQSLIRHLRAVVIHVNTSISADMLFHNIALVQQLKGVTELRMHLRDGCDLPPAAAAAIGAMRQLTSLSIVGGGLSREAAAELLAGLAAGAAAAAASSGSGAAAAAGLFGGEPGGLRSLTLLPAVQHGLGDGEMGALAACSSIEVLEFRAHRLTSAGLATLSLGLPRLTRLAISSLDSDSGYELACLERLARLAELDLALDQAPTGDVSRRALCAVKPGRSLSLSFRWTERAQGLLTEYGNRLANLTHLDVGACRVGSESLFEAVAQLTGLRELRMAVYSNADHCIPCHLSRLSALAALQRFHLEKRRAYFPEARRFGESSIAVPVTAEGLRTLAGRWSRLRSLRLALSRKDYSAEGLSVLSSFTGLRDLGIVVERYPTAGQAQTQTQTHQVAQQQQGLEQAAAAGEAVSGTGGGSLGRLSRRSVELPPALDLCWLPPGLTSLELNSLVLEMREQGPHGRHSQGGEAQAPQPEPGLGLGLGGMGPQAWGLGTASAPVAAGLTFSCEGVDAAPQAGAASPSLPSGAAAVPAPASAAPPPPPVASLPALPLFQLSSLDVEACVVRPALLAEVARRCGASLRSLRLVGVVGLTDAALAGCAASLPALRALTVSAPGNRAGTMHVGWVGHVTVTQAGLAALSARRPPPLLRQLTWESDDLTSRGPQLAALAPLTSLRHLSLSCTDKTAELALGSLSVLQDALPYCYVDMVWTGARPDTL
ncbi:hypothetical protein GPECTOR_10g853 [Gonium pectorale]|uniref:F-box domain-containing protein n=1 Tax=Gonium pectorale TaxID=33097 RepID=A0A150GR49_GONPE|nr:hypothetical protein GPECTOR_10g853 [Gonium pectorale]|eukprot:KXZ52222.1 hypothetical protein GPECTOR_10g853 [Gonium pectorale]